LVERVAYRGLLSEQAKSLTDEQYLEMLNSRERRFIKRNSMQFKEIMEQVKKHRKNGKPIRTHLREAVILPSWVGLTFSVYTGKDFQNLEITANMLGHRLGEFAYTTKRVVHSAPGVRATRGSKFLAQK